MLVEGFYWKRLGLKLNPWSVIHKEIRIPVRKRCMTTMHGCIAWLQSRHAHRLSNEKRVCRCEEHHRECIGSFQVEKQSEKQPFCARFCEAWRVKGALSRYSVILCRYFAVENGGEETRGRGAGQRETLTGLFRNFFFPSFELRDQSTSGYQSVTLTKSFLSRTKMGFEIRSRKWKQKTSLPMKNGENSWKPKQACGAPRIDLELSWSEDCSKLATLSGAVVYISLHSQCTVR